MNQPTNPTFRSTVRGRAARRMLRTIGLLTLAYPYVFVTVPLAVFLVAHLIKSLLAGEPMVDHPWSASELLHCTACVAAIIAFVCLVLGHLVITVIAGWRNTD